MDLETIRKKFDAIDTQIIELLSERNALSEEMGHHKKIHQLKVYDRDRENKLIDHLKEMAIAKKLDKKLVEDIYDIILKNSRQIQENC